MKQIETELNHPQHCIDNLSPVIKTVARLTPEYLLPYLGENGQEILDRLLAGQLTDGDFEALEIAYSKCMEGLRAKQKDIWLHDPKRNPIHPDNKDK